MKSTDARAAAAYITRKLPTDTARDVLEALGLIEPSVCGTLAGHSRHTRRGQASCDPCRLAYNAYMARYKNARRGA